MWLMRPKLGPVVLGLVIARGIQESVQHYKHNFDTVLTVAVTAQLTGARALSLLTYGE